MSALADEAGFIVVYPQALGDPPTWHVGPLAGGANDLEFLSDLIDDLASRYPIDPRRVYATGISNGGGMVDRLGCGLADRLAAIASVSGAYLFWEDCHPSRPLPVLAFHGTGDEIVPYEGEGRVLPSVRTWAAAWASRDGCRSGPETVLRAGAVTGERWSACPGSAEVVLYTIEAGGHWWPGADFLPGANRPTDEIDATATMWAFFQAHPLP
jgi:polyhydroxybutyrate depolymerase